LIMKKISCFALLLALLFCLCTGFTSPVFAGGEDFYSFIWLSDTQHYSSDYPYIYRTMTQWVANHAEELHLKYVFHTGDFVNDRGSKAQWALSDEAMKKIDDTCPWFAIAGNHDVGTSGDSYSYFLKHAGKDHFDALGNTDSIYYKNGIGRCDFFTHGEREYMFIGIGWESGSGALSWLKKMLANYPEKEAILLVHSYLDTDGELNEHGLELFDEIVSEYANVKLVLCGHRYASRVRINEFDDDGDGRPDREVYQIMGNYQAAGHGGQGFLRILKVYDDRIEMIAYSPYLDAYDLTDDMPEPQPESMVIPTEQWADH